MNDCKLECTKAQLRLIQKALEFYNRVGIGQFDVIKDHPTFEEALYRQFSPTKELEIGDETLRGVVTKITKSAVWTKGSWGNGEEIRKWTDVEKVKHSPDWDKMHDLEKEVDDKLNEVRNLLYGETMSKNGSWGIYNSKVDESCREAFEIVQKVRHAFWKENPDRSNMTVDSSDINSNIKVCID